MGGAVHSKMLGAALCKRHDGGHLCTAGNGNTCTGGNDFKTGIY